MSAAPLPARAGEVRRRSPRCPASLPLDVIVLRFGVPCAIPGRSLDLGEKGVAAVLAGELRVGESVGIELHLPGHQLPVRSKAVVRYHNAARCGLEFLSLNEEHEESLHRWMLRMSEIRPIRKSAPVAARSTLRVSSSALARTWRRLALIVCTLAALVALFAWWQWERSWRDLESKPSQVERDQPPLRVPAEAMESLLRHKTEPTVPDDARQLGANGLVILRVTIGRDGTVVDLHPLSGPQWLQAPAMEAVRWWRYQPYRIDGRPVAVETTVAVEFTGN